MSEAPTLHTSEAQAHNDAELLQLVTFRIAEEEFGVDIVKGVGKLDDRLLILLDPDSLPEGADISNIG